MKLLHTYKCVYLTKCPCAVSVHFHYILFHSKHRETTNLLFSVVDEPQVIPLVMHTTVAICMLPHGQWQGAVAQVTNLCVGISFMSKVENLTYELEARLIDLHSCW